ncbi:telomere maintenance protein [Malassezia pachydermatis]|uniref:Telomere maintenance protein n=1 Tax=Malassezia pachydermatis TaxID=77020 RepID=A0A0M9VR85_9BASI|nr:telomere maintenance protein [Malassezia pachydermatis]KOS16349.1 telomere maintenance protein [Malassezia pachydermatis]
MLSAYQVCLEPVPASVSLQAIRDALAPQHAERVTLKATEQADTMQVIVDMASAEDQAALLLRNPLTLGQATVHMASIPSGIDAPVTPSQGIGLQKKTWAHVVRQGAPTAHTSNDTAPVQRNLYILNLPLDVSEDDLKCLFTPFGEVEHSVILAMLDTQARRRGFVDMDTPQSAQAAVRAMDGYVWHGYPLEVSYALIQRQATPAITPNSITSPWILVDGLVTTAILDEADVHALLAPYANVTKIEFPTFHSLDPASTFGVRVCLASTEEAQQVHTALDGASMHGYIVSIKPASGDTS